MSAFLLSPLRLAVLLALVLCGSPGFMPNATAQTSPPRPGLVFSPGAVEQVPRLVGGGDIIPALEAAVQSHLVLPKGISVSAQSRVFVQFTVGKTGRIENLVMVNGLLTTIDARLLAAIRALPVCEPGRLHGQPVRVAYHNLPLRLLGPASPPQPPARAPRVLMDDSTAHRLEARTLRKGFAQRRPGESADDFVGRVFPFSFSENDQLIAYSWLPGPFGQQLFFAAEGHDDNEYGSDLFVLDPTGADTYDVQVLPLETMGDHTGLEALFFADVNQDGQKELLALCVCSLREGFTADDGTRLTGRAPHYTTYIFQYRGVDTAGRSRYEQDLTPRPYLDELATAVEVRQALAQHQLRPKAGKPKRGK